MRCTLFVPVLFLACTPLPGLAQGGGAEVRVENEFKLSVPNEQLEPLREYLRGRYGLGDGSILRELGSDFTATISDERFVDRYFDTPGLDLIKAESGVRRRQRWNLGDASQDRKHGRQLLQLKLRRPTDDNPLNRTEVKFEVDPPNKVKSSLDRHPLLGLVDRDDRPALTHALREYGIDAEEMRPTITIEQRRWRVYISRGGSAFATLTLDEVQSGWLLSRVEFVELEIELNEIAYTEAAPAARAELETFSRRMADDILGAFPTVEQDQTPKYNKVFLKFEERIPGFDSLVVHGEVVKLFVLLGCLLMVTLFPFAVQRFRRWLAARRSARERDQTGGRDRGLSMRRGGGAPPPDDGHSSSG